MMRRVGLHEVLQMECLGRKSSVLEIFTGKVRGRIFIAEGQIVHAESGALQGEVALYGLLGLRGGEFNLRPFSEPSRRTIAGQYEFLLMEAARLSDEGANLLDSAPGPLVAAENLPASGHPEAALSAAASFCDEPVRIEEIVLSSGAAEILYEWQCHPIEGRIRLLQQIEQQSAMLSKLLPAGRFDRAEILTSDSRIVCQIQPDMRLFVRSAISPGT